MLVLLTLRWVSVADSAGRVVRVRIHPIRVFAIHKLQLGYPGVALMPVIREVQRLIWTDPRLTLLPGRRRTHSQGEGDL